MNDTIIPFISLDNSKKNEAVDIFLAGFSNMFTFATKAELVQLFSTAFEETQVYVYIIENHVCGVLGLGTNTKRALKFDKQICLKLFGKTKGRIIYYLLHKTSEIPAVKKDTDLYVDYLTIDPQMRKKGIATKLLNFAWALPKYKYCYLEVLSKNILAAKLYKKLGFTIHKKGFNIFTIVQGLGYPIVMKKLLIKAT